MDKQIKLDLTQKPLFGEVNLPLSKSLCNRALLLSAGYPQIKLGAISDADDTQVLVKGLKVNKGEVDVGAAGTAMRFLAAHFASTTGAEVILTGTQRMLQRPIGELVSALRQLGADIGYQEKEGFPPLRIIGKELSGGDVSLDGSVSSQFVTALMLIGPRLKQGLTLNLMGEIVSRPYITMTAGLMQQMGFSVRVSNSTIRIEPAGYIPARVFKPEADWSAAAFWYGMLASAKDGELELPGLMQRSLQGDSRMVRIFEELGIKTTFTELGAKLVKRPAQLPGKLVVNLVDNPDLAQPLAFTCAALGIGADLRGLQTLRIKETDRLAAIKTELTKVGVEVIITENSLQIDATSINQPSVPIDTYEDHRMAMSAAILATSFPVIIANPEVVTKSYRGFWADITLVFFK